LLVPGCAALEDLTGISRQSADEIYNELDFAEASKSDAPSITLSYGESTSVAQPVDFAPLVQLWPIRTSQS
jgi:hypothetical protein